MPLHDNITVQSLMADIGALMREIDKHEDLDAHPLRESEAYKQAVHSIGWDVDWEAIHERRQEAAIAAEEERIFNDPDIARGF